MQGTNRFLGLGNKSVDKGDLDDFFSILTAECRDNLECPSGFSADTGSIDNSVKDTYH